MQKANELVIGYLKHLQSLHLKDVDESNLEVAVNILEECLHVNCGASPELMDIANKLTGAPSVSSVQYKEQGNNALRAGDAAKAEELYTMAISQSQRFGEPIGQRAIYFANRAMAKQKLNKLDEAIQDLRQCVELDSTYQKGWSRLGSCLEQKGLKNEALDCYKRINDQEGIQRCSQQAAGQNPFQNLNKDELLKQFP